MPERVVDGLEVVEVDDHHGHLARGARLERLAHLPAEQRARGEPGERVVVGLVLELVLQIVQLGDGVLEAVVLERGARVGGQGLEQGAVVVGEAAREAEAVREHDRADHAILAAQHAEHAVPDTAILEVGVERRRERREQCDRGVGARGAGAQGRGRGRVERRHRLAGGARAEAGAQRHATVGGEQDDLGLLGVEGLERPFEQTLERDGDLG